MEYCQRVIFTKAFTQSRPLKDLSSKFFPHIVINPKEERKNEDQKMLTAEFSHIFDGVCRPMVGPSFRVKGGCSSLRLRPGISSRLRAKIEEKVCQSVGNTLQPKSFVQIRTLRPKSLLNAILSPERILSPCKPVDITLRLHRERLLRSEIYKLSNLIWSNASTGAQTRLFFVRFIPSVEATALTKSSAKKLLTFATPLGCFSC